MKHSTQTVKRFLLTSVAAFFISTMSLPAVTWADVAPSPSPSPAPTSSIGGSSSVSGASATPPASNDATPYIYNANTGLWENDMYTWDPTTGQTTPKTPVGYSYNPTTGHWDNTGWVYDPTTGTYVQNPNTPVSTPTPSPTPTPTPSPTPEATPQVNGGTSSAAPLLNSAATPTLQSAPTKSTSTSLGLNNSSVFDSFYNPSISNVVSSGATSGNALVMGNTNAGDASSGNATAIANVINLLQSAASLTGGNLSTFTDNINGDVNGNLLIDPAQLASLQSASANDSTNLAVNSTANATMNNAITANATSGDATVSSNTTAGSATTGNANAVADVVNLINSIIAAKQSFLGVVNIYGNLNGDITVPQGFVDSLLANNATAPDSNNSNTQAVATNTDVTNNATQAITNAVTTAANTGNATVSGNTTAGNATTGNAANNVTILNLTGQNVVAANSLLVFVNVLGHWVGLILNAPAGASAAALGGGVTSNTLSGQANVQSTNNIQITNNIGLTATSGNAGVTNNTHAGNATTGDATTSASLANITGSQFGLSNWFGILFINVFGSWLGNFTVQPNQVAASTNSPASAVFQFVPTGGGQSAGTQAYKLTKLWQTGSGFVAPSSPTGSLQNTVLAASKSKASTGRIVAKPKAVQPSYSRANAIVAGSIVGVGAMLFALDGYRTYRRRHVIAT